MEAARLGFVVFILIVVIPLAIVGVSPLSQVGRTAWQPIAGRMEPPR